MQELKNCIYLYLHVWINNHKIFIEPFDCFWEIPLQLTTQQTFVLVKTYWRRLQCNIFFIFQDVLKTSWRRLENVLKTSWKTSWRRFRKTYCKYVFKTSWKTKNVTLKTSWKTRNVCWAMTVFASLPEVESVYYHQRSYIRLICQ